MFLEQGFSMIRVKDMTERLLSEGFIGTYNVPYNQQIYDKLQYQQRKYMLIQINSTMRPIPAQWFSNNSIQTWTTKKT